MRPSSIPPRTDSAQHRWKFFTALAVTSLSILLLVSLFWAMSAVKFRSVVAIQVRPAKGQAAPNMLEEFANAVREELTHAGIDELIDATRETQPLRSSLLEYREYDQIIDAIRVGEDPLRSDGTVQLLISFDGMGLADEQVWVQQLAERVAHRFQRAQPSAASHRGQIHQAHQLASSLQQRLANHPADSEFRLAGTRRVVGGAETSHQATIHQMKQLTQQLDQLRLEDEGQNSADHRIREVGAVTTMAIGTRPSRIQTWCLFLAAAVLGSVVALNYPTGIQQPLGTVAEVETELGVKVIATIGDTEAHSDPVPRKQAVWATQVVEAGKGFLMVALVVVSGFLLLDEGIREAFFQHPIDGLARMVRVFIGY